jgi:DNA polymerase-3 subunit alpha (Gram-positive type)
MDVQPSEIKCVDNIKDIPLKNSEYVVFDIETTGLYACNDDIIEFGAIKLKNNVVIDRIDLFIKPSKIVTDKILSMTHISNEMLKNGKDIKEALKIIVD